MDDGTEQRERARIGRRNAGRWLRLEPPAAAVPNVPREKQRRRRL